MSPADHDEWRHGIQFAGHAVIPSLAKDMIDPSQFDYMIDWAFVVASVIYMLIGYAGYLMFGANVSEEVCFAVFTGFFSSSQLNRSALIYSIHLDSIPCSIMLCSGCLSSTLCKFHDLSLDSVAYLSRSKFALNTRPVRTKFK